VDYHLYIRPFDKHFVDVLDHQFHLIVHQIMELVLEEELKLKNSKIERKIE